MDIYIFTYGVYWYNVPRLHSILMLRLDARILLYKQRHVTNRLHSRPQFAYITSRCHDHGTLGR